jgi:hypothetical protein
MNRIATGLCVAAAFSFATALGAQTSSTSSTTSSMSKDKEVTVTGCLQRGADGNYMLTNAMMDDAMHGGASTTGTTGTTSGATTSGSAMSHSTTAASTWTLEGGSDLDKHVGHKIQVTGREVESSKKEYDTSSKMLVSSRNRARRVLEVAGIDRIIPVHPTLHAAFKDLLVEAVL